MLCPGEELGSNGAACAKGEYIELASILGCRITRLPVWVEGIVEAGAVAVFIDNSGFVWAHRKGCSRDEYVWTLAKFMEDFGKGLGVKTEMPEGLDVSERCSKVLERWIHDPRVDRDLARRVLGEVQSKVDVFIGMDITLEMGEMVTEGKLEVRKEKE